MPRWAVALVGALVTGLGLVLVYLFYVADPDQRIAGNPTDFGQTAIRDPGVLVYEPSASNLLGRAVVLEDVRVTRVVGNYLFWIRADSGEVPVVLFGEVTSRQPERAKVIRAGQRLRIYGRVRQVRDLEGLGPFLSSEQRAEVRRRDIYLSAMRVVVLSEGPSVR